MNREKWYFIRDFIKEFFLVILKILAVIVIFAGAAFVFYACIIQPWYLLVVAGFIVVFCIATGLISALFLLALNTVLAIIICISKIKKKRLLRQA